MSVVILKYNAGNSRSVKYALDRLSVNAVISSDPEALRNADKVIIPGVGSAGAAMNYLRDQKLDEVIRSLTQPVLGICLGMQLLCNISEEDHADCLGVVDQDVRRFSGQEKVPHTGWNRIANFRSPLFEAVATNSYVYFVHSYYVPVCDQSVCTSGYIRAFSAGIQQNNFYGLQFHPEKSGTAGEQILRNFLRL